MSLLACSQLSYAPTDTQKLFTNFDLTIDTSEVTILLGESGTGKTTLGLLLAGALVPDSGEITIDGVPLNEMEWSPGFLHQNPENQIFGTTVERDIAFGLENRNTPRKIMEEKVTETLRLFQLQSIREKSTANLSGGEKQRTALAGLFVMEYPFFILDESTSYLDYPAQRDLYQQLEVLQKQGIGVLWITQYPEEVVLGDRIIHLGNNKILHDTSPDEYPIPQESLDFMGQSQTVTMKNEKPLFAVSDGEFSYPEWESENPFRLTVPDYSLARNMYQGWYGYSGAGKSTLAKLIAGLEEFDNGEVDSTLTEDDIIYVPQFAEQMLHSGTVEQTTHLLRHRPGFQKDLFLANLRKEFQAFGIVPDEPFERPVWSFSGGEQRRIVLSVALALRPTVLILDEPTIGISPGDRKKLDHIFTSREIPAIICVSHEYEFLRHYMEKVVYFHDGTVEAPQAWDGLESELSAEDIFLKKPIPSELSHT